MKKFVLLLSLIAFSLSSCSQRTERNNADPTPVSGQTKIDEKKPYTVSSTHSGDSARIVSLLTEGKTLPKGENVIIHYARAFLGLPYVAFTLDQNDDECLVINTEGLDCTTFVENVTALALCANRKITDFKGFCDMLTLVRYIHGEVSYPTRQHYFTTWISANQADGLLTEISLPPSPWSESHKPNVNYMTTHVDAYRMLSAHREWVPAIKEMEDAVNQTTFTFIPKAKLLRSEKYRDVIRDGDIIAIVTNKAGLDISHVGFARWHKDGLHMMHASSLRKKVIDDPTSLYEYLQKQKSAVGIRVVRMADVK